MCVCIWMRPCVYVLMSAFFSSTGFCCCSCAALVFITIVYAAVWRYHKLSFSYWRTNVVSDLWLLCKMRLWIFLCMSFRCVCTHFRWASARSARLGHAHSVPAWLFWLHANRYQSSVGEPPLYYVLIDQRNCLTWALILRISFSLLCVCPPLLPKLKAFSRMRWVKVTLLSAGSRCFISCAGSSQPGGATPRPRSGAEARRTPCPRGGGREELPHVRGHGRRPRVPGSDSAGAAKRSYPSPRLGAAARRSYPTSEVRGGGREEQPHFQGVVAARAQEGLEELLHVQGQEGQWWGDTPHPR